MNIKPPYRLVSLKAGRNQERVQTDCPTVEKNPFAIRAAMNELNVVAAPHHAAVGTVTVKNQNNTGARPKYVDNIITTMPPAPSMNKLPTNE